jgi:hypothetical protein
MTITGAAARTTSVLGEVVTDRSTQGDQVFDVQSGASGVVIQGFTISGGTGNGVSGGCFGGDVHNAGDLTLREDTITNGRACSGGGVSNDTGTLLVDRSTITGNSAPFGGGDSGGIQNFGNGDIHGALTIRNSTITGNSARLGGGVFSWNDTQNTIDVENSTIALNQTGATVGGPDRGLGGIGGGEGTFTFTGTIVANNTSSGSPSNCAGTIVSNGFNLETGTDCGFTQPGDQQSADPRLVGLANNGGPTDTQAIPSSSPAVDAGGPTCPTTDQRGTTRPQGAACDVGAFEFAPATPPPSGGGGGGGATPPLAVAPTVAGQAAPTVASDSATVTATISPHGSPTTVVVQYGTSAAYGQQTAPVSVGAGNTPQTVTITITGLTPSTLYHFRFLATNAAGSSAGPDQTVTSAVPGGASQQPPPPPVQGQSVNVLPFLGTVLVNGQPLAAGQNIPLGSTVDATNGTVILQILVNGVLQTGQFSGGVFKILQLPDGTIQLLLVGGDFSICKASKTTRLAQDARTIRKLWGNASGSFQTKGRYAAATVRGTIWLVADRCDGTFVRVRSGIVSVQNFISKKTIFVKAPKSYLAKPAPPKKK